MICAKCGGNVHTDHVCDGCGITYEMMISSIRHPWIKKLISKGSLSEEDKPELAELLADSSFLVSITFVSGNLQVMSVSDDENRIYIPIFTDKEEYDKNIEGIIPITNPFEVVLDLLDERFEGFVINVFGDGFVLNNEFLKMYM